MMRKLVGTLAVVFLAAQIAPVVHAIVPHEDDTPHCTDGLATPHAEKHTRNHDEPPCAVCIHATSQGALLESASVLVTDVPLSVEPPAASRLAAGSEIHLPVCRGPPTLPS